MDLSRTREKRPASLERLERWNWSLSSPTASDQLSRSQWLAEKSARQIGRHPWWSRNWVEVCEHELRIDFSSFTFFFLLFYSPPLREEQIIFLASPAESEIWYELRLCCKLWLAWATKPPHPLLSFLFHGESDSLLPRDSTAVMCSFRLACQPPFNWLARLERRYQRRAVIDLANEEGRVYRHLSVAPGRASFLLNPAHRHRNDERD